MEYAHDEERGEPTLGGRASLPTMYVENELQSGSSSNAHLRFRNRSQEGPISPSSRSNPCYGTPTTYTTTSPCTVQATPDSGIDVTDEHMDDSTLHEPTKPLRFMQNHRNLYEEGSFAEEEDGTYDALDTSWDELKRHWKRNQIRFDTPMVFPTWREAAPALVVLAILASACFTVVVVQNAVRRASDSGLRTMEWGGKYESIEYAHRRRREALEQSGRLLPDELKSEEGVVLGGKRASIQYAYDLKGHEAAKEARVEAESRAQELEDMIEVLSVKEDDSPELAQDKKERLLQKLRDSGHFSTTKVEPLELDIPNPTKVKAVSDVIIEKAKPMGPRPRVEDETKRRKKRVASSEQTKRSNPLESFRITDTNRIEDDPFRFF
eukprot:maker-scaffold1516_size37830-snap-gene-0.9 protein:Tk12637 transcript:maker-scaffold1516_size37830-snap-gene-0.9-mRNA-1 annotation:"dna mismatch repair protein"